MNELRLHEESRKLINCSECSKDVREDQMELHLQNHMKMRKSAKSTVYRKPSTSKDSNKEQKRKYYTGYTIWQTEERKKIVEENKNLHHLEVSSELGKRWKQLSKEAKTELRKRADELNVSDLTNPDDNQ